MGTPFQGRVLIGMDPHKRSATIEMMTGDEVVVGSGRFATDRDGYAEMRRYAGQWPDRSGRSRAVPVSASTSRSGSWLTGRRSSTCRPSRSWVQGAQRTKTRRSTRNEPLPRVVAETLSVHIAAFPPGEDGTLFTTRFGTPYRHDYYGTRILAAAVTKAGLPPPITSHDLRHHYASVLLAQGESVVAVAERLGHHNAGLVLSTYGHLMPDSEARTRRAVDSAWSASAPSAPQAEGASP